MKRQNGKKYGLRRVAWDLAKDKCRIRGNLDQSTDREFGYADESLWFFSLGDSAKLRRTVSCDESWPETYEQADEHELVIDPGCFGHVYPPWFAPQFPVVSASNVDAAAANDVVVQHYGQNVVY